MSPGPNRRLALAVLCTADVIVTLDAMVVSLALPSIGRELGFSDAGLQWVITAYTLMLGSFLLLGGRLADALGRRRTLLLGIGVFTAASLLGGLARAPAPLLAARALAGFGGALAIPAALALIAAVFPTGTERERALGWLSLAIDVGAVAGAVLGGLVVSALGWPWAFFLIVPFGLATLAAAPRAIDESRPRRPGQGLDVAGALLAAAGLAMLIVALSRAEVDGLVASATLAAFAAALALLAGLAVVERRAAAPLLSPALLRRRRALAACLAVVANAGAFSGLLVISTLYMQRVLGFSALEAGLGLVPLAVSAGVGGPLAAPLLARHGVRRVVLASLLVTAAGLGALALTVRLASYAAALLPVFAVTGLTFATAAVPLMAEAVAGADESEQGAAAGLFQTFTHVGGGAVVLAVLVISAAARADAVRHGGASETAALICGYRLAFLLAAALLVGGAATVAALLSRPRPARPCPAGARARAGRRR